MKGKFFFTAFVVTALGMASCNQPAKKTSEHSHDAVVAEKVKTVMTKEMQEQMTPDEALKDLMDGNKRYLDNQMINRDLPAQITATSDGQYPKAIVLGCVDSRVPIEYLFDQGIGDIFVARVAGNIEDEDLLGSMEYGLGVAGSKLLMILGHENCGAVKSAISKVDVGSLNVTHLLNEIEPAIQEVEGERDYHNKEYFNKVIKNNVLQTVEDIRKRSHIISNLEKEGKIKVVGAYYNLHDGSVTLLEDEAHAGHNH